MQNAKKNFDNDRLITNYYNKPFPGEQNKHTNKKNWTYRTSTKIHTKKYIYALLLRQSNSLSRFFGARQEFWQDSNS